MRTTQDFLCLLVNVRWCDGFLFSKYYGEALTQELFSGGNLAIFPNDSLKGDLKFYFRHSGTSYTRKINSISVALQKIFSRKEKYLLHPSLV